MRAAEQQLLGLLIGGRCEPEFARRLCERLRAHSFHSMEHRVLFESIASLIGAPPGEIVRLLPARLVRAGFPEIDLSPFLEPRPVCAEHAEELLGILVCDRFSQP